MWVKPAVKARMTGAGASWELENEHHSREWDTEDIQVIKGTRNECVSWSFSG
jgi:hypothetical protein